MFPLIVQSYGILTLKTNLHSENQDDKSLVDVQFAIYMMYINRFVENYRENVTTARQVVSALNFN